MERDRLVVDFTLDCEVGADGDMLSPEALKGMAATMEGVGVFLGRGCAVESLVGGVEHARYSDTPSPHLHVFAAMDDTRPDVQVLSDMVRSGRLAIRPMWVNEAVAAFSVERPEDPAP